MSKPHKSVAGFVDSLQRMGRYTFTRADVRRDLGQQDETLTKGLQRLARANRIHSIRRGFYVVVPLEYASTGTPPIEWFIDDLMQYIGHPYYVGALTAASLQGAAHQRPQEYQLVVPVSARTIRTGRVRIRFFRYDGVADVQTVATRTFTGDIPVSTPECTALDLVRFNKNLGGLDAVLTVLTELGESIHANALLAAARRERTRAHVQRLGWLLDQAGWETCTGPVARWLSRQKPSRVPLNSWLNKRQGPTSSKWAVIVNDLPESET